MQQKAIILVMDDETVIRDVTTRMLELLGYETVEVEDGTQALEKLRGEDHHIGAALFDLTVPGGMGGREAVVELRKFNSELPVFSSSGYSDDPVMADPRLYGFTDSIAKPYRLKELSSLLARYLG
jgi:CheY-like chemotaxis protein